MIRRVLLKNFMCFKDLDLRLYNRKGSVQPVVVLLGVPGSGKTALLQSFAFLRKSIDLLTFNQLYATRHKSKYTHSYQPQKLSEMVRQVYRNSACGIMQLTWQFSIKGRLFVYELLFHPNGSIFSESLIKQNGLVMTSVFHADARGVSFGMGMIAHDDQERFQAFYDRYFGDYTVLSIVFYGLHHQLFSIKKTWRDLVTDIIHWHLRLPGYDHQQRYNYLRDCQYFPEEGYVGEQGKLFLKALDKPLSELLQGLFPMIDHVRYVFTKKLDKEVHYQLQLFVKTEQGLLVLPRSQWPSSLSAMISYSTAGLDLFLGMSAFLDELADRTNPFLIQRFMNRYISGEQQLFLPMRSGALLNVINPDAVYVFRYHLDGCTITPLQELLHLRNPVNTRLRYEKYMEQHYATLSNNRFFRYADWLRKLAKLVREEPSEHDERSSFMP